MAKVLLGETYDHYGLAYASQRKLLKTSTGKLVAFVDLGSNLPTQGIRYKVSDDNGVTWGSWILAYNDHVVNDYGFDVRIDSSDNIHLLVDRSAFYYLKLTYDGSNWSNGTPVYVEGEWKIPSILVRNNGDIWIAGQIDSNFRTWFSIDGGLNFSAASGKNAGGYVRRVGLLEVGSEVWVFTYASDLRVFKYSTSWDSGTLIASSVGISSMGFLKISDSNIWVACRTANGIKAFHYNGSVWDSGTLISNNAADDEPSLSNVGGNPVCIWYLFSTTKDIFYNKFNGLTWGSPVNITNDIDSDWYPSTLEADDNYLQFVWITLQSANHPIYFQSTLIIPVTTTIQSDKQFNIDALKLLGLDKQFNINYFREESLLAEYEIVSEINAVVDHSKFLNLLPLVPEKFRSSQLLKDYLEEVGVLMGTWLLKIEESSYLLDPYKVSEDYIQYLSSLIGLFLVRDESTTIDNLRKQIIQAIDWYKLKGTYIALKVVAYLVGLAIIIHDMYTNDYAAFTSVEWFVGNENENPPGLDSNYYKSPHFGLEILLNKVYESPTPRHLWREDKFINLRKYVEEVRPVNTIPHYTILLNPQTSELGGVTVVDGDIRTIVLGTWEFSRLYFDFQVITGSTGWYFDNGKHFDWLYESFINSITKWKLGTGSKGIVPDTNFNLENQVLDGTVDDIRILGDFIEFEFVLFNSVQTQMSELVLCTSDGTARIGSTFPDIDLTLDVSLRVVVRVNKV